MRFRHFLLSAVACILLAQDGSAQITDVICDDRDRLEKRLMQVVGAVRQGRGMRGSDALIEIWIDMRSGDWTMVQSYANGRSCIVAIGENWESLSSDADPA